MKVYYAKPSPFARRARVLLRERRLLSQIDEIATAPWDSPVELLAVSAASKVPTLVLDDGEVLSESALIATHPQIPELRWPLVVPASPCSSCATGETSPEAQSPVPHTSTEESK
jgi:hypothetical protein